MSLDRNSFSECSFNSELQSFQFEYWNEFSLQQPGKDTTCDCGKSLITMSAGESQSFSSKITYYQKSPKNCCVDKIIELYKADCAHLGTPISDIRATDGSVYIEDKIAEAEELLRSISPKIFEFTSKYISSLIIVESNQFTASSSLKFLGNIILAPKPDWHPLEYVSSLVHETAHIDLYIRQLYDPFVSSQQLMRSPFRKDLRPANGVMHAAFVLSRMLQVFEALASNCRYAEALNDFTYRARIFLSQAAKELATSGVLTDMGEKMIEEFYEIAGVSCGKMNRA